MNKFSGFPISIRNIFVVSSSLHLQQEKSFPLCVYLFCFTFRWDTYNSKPYHLEKDFLLALVSSFNILLQKCISVDLSCICIFGNLYLRLS